MMYMSTKMTEEAKNYIDAKVDAKLIEVDKDLRLNVGNLDMGRIASFANQMMESKMQAYGMELHNEFRAYRNDIKGITNLNMSVEDAPLSAAATRVQSEHLQSEKSLFERMTALDKDFQDMQNTVDEDVRSLKKYMKLHDTKIHAIELPKHPNRKKQNYVWVYH